MKIYKDGKLQDLTEMIQSAENELKSNVMHLVSSLDHCLVAASYIAWKNVGGVLFIRSPMLAEVTSRLVTDAAINKSKTISDSIMLHTSGSTGTPTLVVHTPDSLLKAAKLSTDIMMLTNESNYLVVAPAFTGAFILGHCAPIEYVNGSMTVTPVTTLNANNSLVGTTMMVSPGLIDTIIARNETPSWRNIDHVIIISAQVLTRHAKFLFDNGATLVTHAYGLSEGLGAVIYKRSTSMSDTPTFISIPDQLKDFVKIENNQLFLHKELCAANFSDLTTDSTWYATADLWESRGDNLFVFIGRSNDIVKINDQTCSLLVVESTVEERTDLGNCIVAKRHTAGVDWLELFYDNNASKMQKQELKKILSLYLSKNDMPKKFTYIKEIPRNGLGKKVREVLPARK